MSVCLDADADGDGSDNLCKIKHKVDTERDCGVNDGCKSEIIPADGCLIGCWLTGEWRGNGEYEWVGMDGGVDGIGRFSMLPLAKAKIHFTGIGLVWFGLACIIHNRTFLSIQSCLSQVGIFVFLLPRLNSA